MRRLFALAQAGRYQFFKRNFRWIDLFGAAFQIVTRNKPGHRCVDKVRITEILRPICKDTLFDFRNQVDILIRAKGDPFKLIAQSFLHGQELGQRNSA